MILLETATQRHSGKGGKQTGLLRCVVKCLVVGNGLVDPSLNPGRSYSSHSVNTLVKCMNQSNPPPAMGK